MKFRIFQSNLIYNYFRYFNQVLSYEHNKDINDYIWRWVQQRTCRCELLQVVQLHLTAAEYLTYIISIHHPWQLLRNSNILNLDIPKSPYRLAGDQTFTFHAVSLWDQLPADIRNMNQLSLSRLKTHLFRKACDSFLSILSRSMQIH